MNKEFGEVYTTVIEGTQWDNVYYFDAPMPEFASYKIMVWFLGEEFIKKHLIKTETVKSNVGKILEHEYTKNKTLQEQKIHAGS